MCFRPLAGISCVYNPGAIQRLLDSFRPLAGISCVSNPAASNSCSRCFRPLAGISCVDCAISPLIWYISFPSPRGDKLCHLTPHAITIGDMFPSPRGDKLCLNRWRLGGSVPQGFRPLAGISCVEEKPGYARIGEFPSPRGDKLCRCADTIATPGQEFPSPRGDKLCPISTLFPRFLNKFPSPRGDKLCLN